MNRLYRYAELDTRKINRTARTVPLSFSSETPSAQRSRNLPPEMRKAARLGEDQTYIEILDHDPVSVDLSLLRNRGAFLDEHNDAEHLGVIETAEVVDRVGRAVVKLDTHDKAETRLSQMESNSRPHVSVGYQYTRFLGDQALPGGKTGKRFAWQALEISSVAVPADQSVGVGRAIELSNKQKRIMRTDEIDTPSEIREIVGVLKRDNPDNDELGRSLDTLRDVATVEQWDLPRFKRAAMEKLMQARGGKPANQMKMVDLGFSQDQIGQYSLMRAVQSCVRRDKREPDGLEGEVHQEVLRQARNGGGLGFEAEGFQVPCDAAIRLGRSAGPSRMARDGMQVGTFNAGGAFVATELKLPIIELLRNMSVLDKVGIRTMAGLQGNVVIPREEASVAAYSVGEIGALTDSLQVLGQIGLSPKRVGATQTYSKQFIMQSSPDAEAFMRDDMFKVISLDWDRLGINGQGASSEPMGVINTPGIGTILFGGTPTYAQIVQMETSLRTFNVRGPLAYISTPKAKGSLKTKPELLTGATILGGAQNAIWKGQAENGTVNGYSAFDTNQVPNDAMILGAWDNLIHAIWGGLDMVVDQYTKAKTGQVVLTINTWGDFAVRHPQAFMVSADSAAQ